MPLGRTCKCQQASCDRWQQLRPTQGADRPLPGAGITAPRLSAVCNTNSGSRSRLRATRAVTAGGYTAAPPAPPLGRSAPQGLHAGDAAQGQACHAKGQVSGRSHGRMRAGCTAPRVCARPPKRCARGMTPSPSAHHAPASNSRASAAARLPPPTHPSARAAGRQGTTGQRPHRRMARAAGAGPVPVWEGGSRGGRS